MIKFASPQSDDAGFTILEALIVLIIGSTLLSVLTPMLLSATQVQQKVSSVFSERSDWLFFDRQMSALVKSFEDPSLRKPKVKTRGQLTFEGHSEYFSGPAHTPFDLSETHEKKIVWVGWLKMNTRPQNELDGLQKSLGKLAAKIEDQWIIWPQHWGPNARFSYIDHMGKKHSKWPPEEEKTGLYSTQPASPISSLPSAIIISDNVAEQGQPNLYTFILKL